MSNPAAAERPLVLITVGGDHHPFRRLMGWMDGWLREHADEVDCVAQHGPADPPEHARGDRFMDHATLLALIRAARVVVTSGGPSTLVECRNAGSLPVVVPRRAALGEVVDDHQHAFTQRMATMGLAVTADSEAALHEALDRALARPDAFRLDPRSADLDAAQSVRAVGVLIDATVASRSAATTRSGRQEHAELPWLVDQIWHRADDDTVEDDEVLLSLNGVPPSYRVVERYVPVPSLAHARFLVPDADAALAAATLSDYNALRSGRARAGRRVLAAGLRTGVLTRLCRDRITIAVPAQRTDADAVSSSLLGQLRVALGRPSMVAAAGVHPPEPNHKPTLQLFDHPAVPVGYAKVGCNEATNALVRTEAAALERLGSVAFRSFRTPSRLWQGTWRGCDVLVTSPLPIDARRYERPRPPLAPLREINTLEATVTPLRGSPYWGRLLDRIATVAADPQHTALGARMGDYLHAVGDAIDARPVGFGTWHGDWVPWNMATSGGRLWVWDWEHAAPEVPVGFDALHWYFQQTFVVERRSLVEAAAAVDAVAGDVLTALGVATDLHQSVCSLYLLEMCLRSYALMAGGGGWQQRMYPEMLRLFAGRERDGGGHPSG